MPEQERQRFSKRHGLRKENTATLIYHDAPESLRVGLLSILKGQLNKSPSWLREVICGVLRIRPNPGNWSEYPNVWDEVQNLLHDADWFRVYDVIEAFHEALRKWHEDARYAALVNDLLEDEGIGWHLKDGMLEIRGDAIIEETLQDAEESLERSPYQIASSELAEARKDLSRRPKPDLSGAVTHAMAALESVVRELTGDSRATLAQAIKANPGIIPKPVDDALVKLYGFSSDQARHGKESRTLCWEEAMLVVGIAAATCSYLLAKEPGE